MSLQELAQHMTKTAEAGGANQWDPCALVQLEKRGAAAVPIFADLLRNPLTRGEAMHSLWDMGEQAAPAIPAVLQVIDEDQENASYGIRLLTTIGAPQAVVPALMKYASSSHEETAITAIAMLQSMGDSASSAINLLAQIALSDVTPPALKAKIRAAATLTSLGRYDPEKVGSYLAELSKHVELASGVCEGIQFMGPAAKPWASDLRADFGTALVVAQKREEEIHNSEPSVDLYRELMHTREGAWCIKQALAMLADNADSTR